MDQQSCSGLIGFRRKSLNPDRSVCIAMREESTLERAINSLDGKATRRSAASSEIGSETESQSITTATGAPREPAAASRLVPLVKNRVRVPAASSASL